jgi:hypothetical protein
MRDLILDVVSRLEPRQQRLLRPQVVSLGDLDRLCQRKARRRMEPAKP